MRSSSSNSLSGWGALFASAALLAICTHVVRFGAVGMNTGSCPPACALLHAMRFFEKVMDLSLLIFTLETKQFCMKCIESTTSTRTYNFKNLAVGSLIWSAKTGIFSSKIWYVPCSLLHIDALGKPRRLGLLGAYVNKNK
jgi:hypothetical protein